MKAENKSMYLKNLKNTYQEKKTDLTELIDAAKSFRERIALNSDIEQLRWRIRYLEKVDNN